VLAAKFVDGDRRADGEADRAAKNDCGNAHPEAQQDDLDQLRVERRHEPDGLRGGVNEAVHRASDGMLTLYIIGNNVICTSEQLFAKR
jgi:hypothetical protein